MFPLIAHFYMRLPWSSYLSRYESLAKSGLKRVESSLDFLPCLALIIMSRFPEQQDKTSLLSESSVRLPEENISVEVVLPAASN